ncbi:hypothetical protein DL546_003129 [Coniochaeta pulveracea]|uniref:D-xylose 1-dehydrogenase (NADP(+), D-xylono-1,5-lactone-forming) n=1 Tax=Coniochaeta pulveracea TaxID=177199 RepID=A0A420XYF5_9PEZI|nr:hypothetical protein DL546_003129 [Coniochaeta pulveracea]
MSWTPLDRIIRGLNAKQTEPKRKDALKFGVLGAANSAGWTLMNPAKLHPEVIVQAVSARDRKRAEEYAKANGIPEVRDTYQEILDDPNIDCILVPLPNSLHFEWAVKAIKAGKHVLLEKPSVSNSIEANILFNLPEFSSPNAPVILEAFHYRFHPVWALFRSLITPADVVHVDTFSMIPWWMVTKEHIHFNYNLSGGAMMGMGTYNFAALRLIFDEEPEECISVDAKAFTEGKHHDCDHTFKAKFRFSGDRIGEAYSTLQGPTFWKPSWATATHRKVVVPDKSLPAGQEKMVTREVTVHGWIHAIFWHRIDVKEQFEIRSKEDGRVLKKWTESKSHKAYTFKQAGGQFKDLPGEDTWMSFKYQLDEFVNRVKGRENRYWVSREDSVLQMKMIDMAYEKSGLGLRPTSTYKVE